MTHNEVPHVYGVHPVLTALGNKKRRVRHVLAAPPLDKRLAKKIKQAKVPLIERPTSFLDALTKGANHQGVVALVGQFSYGDLDDLEGLIERLLVGGGGPALPALGWGARPPQCRGAGAFDFGAGGPRVGDPRASRRRHHPSSGQNVGRRRRGLAGGAGGEHEPHLGGAVQTWAEYGGCGRRRATSRGA